MKFLKNLFTIKSNNEIDSNDFIISFIKKEIIDSDRYTEFYQLEKCKFDRFEQNQIIKYLTNSKSDRDYLETQFKNHKDENWDINLEKTKFLSMTEIEKRKLTHFKFSSPIILKNKNMILVKVVYQNAFSENDLKGSICLEMFKKNEKFDWEYSGFLFGTSI